MQSVGQNLEALLRDCRDLVRYIHKTRREIAEMRPQEMKSEKLPRAGQELDAIVQETESATNEIMSAAESIMAAPDDRQAVEAACMRIFEACSFQDITGQRTRKVVHTLTYIEAQLERLQRVMGPDVTDAPREADKDPLLNGPALKGQGVKQSEVDALFD